jgi:hypothetical protein
MIKDFLTRVVAVLRSRRFFVVVIAFFVFEAAWIAMSAVYPQAFDEDFHFGIIRIYSHYWLPFLGSQPPHANAYGAVARDPSYLYQYLMSFPYRIIALVTHSQMAQIICLRLIDVGLFATGLVLFRRVLIRAGSSVAMAQSSILLFTLIPVVPQLAAHINYDNLIFPLVAWVCLLTFDITDQIRQRRLNIRSLSALIIVGLLATQVKYAFLPIFAGAVLFLLFMAGRAYWKKPLVLLAQLRRSWTAQSWRAKALILSFLLVAVGIFAQRDAVNLVEYHTFTPNCSSVLSIKACNAYGPWKRNYTTHKIVQAKVAEGTISYDNPIVYFGQWIYWLWYRLFFAINGPSSNYANYPPLPLPAAAAALLAATGAVAVIVWRRRIFHDNPYIAFFFVVSMLYLASLWVEGYSQYRYTDELVLMNGRYLLPVLLLMGAIIGRAFSIGLHKSVTVRSALALVAILLFVEGGGFLTFITRSDASWDWPNSAVVKVNDAARKITKPVIIKGSKNYTTSFWLFN